MKKKSNLIWIMISAFFVFWLTIQFIVDLVRANNIETYEKGIAHKEKIIKELEKSLKALEKEKVLDQKKKGKYQHDIKVMKRAIWQNKKQINMLPQPKVFFK